MEVAKLLKGIIKFIYLFKCYLAYVLLHVISAQKSIYSSGQDDVIFVNFVGHGGIGVLGLPKEELFADELVESINSMKAKSKYSKVCIVQ